MAGGGGRRYRPLSSRSGRFLAGVTTSSRVVAVRTVVVSTASRPPPTLRHRASCRCRRRSKKRPTKQGRVVYGHETLLYLKSTLYWSMTSLDESANSATMKPRSLSFVVRCSSRTSKRLRVNRGIIVVIQTAGEVGSSYVNTHHITSHHITSHYITLHHIISHHITSHHDCVSMLSLSRLVGAARELGARQPHLRHDGRAAQPDLRWRSRRGRVWRVRSASCVCYPLSEGTDKRESRAARAVAVMRGGRVAQGGTGGSTT